MIGAGVAPCTRSQSAVAIPTRLERALRRRLGGDRRAALDLDLRGRTDFERAVWSKALEIRLAGPADVPRFGPAGVKLPGP